MGPTGDEVTTPVELIIKQHPKWHGGRTGSQQRSREGTFNVANCNEVEANIKKNTTKAKDTSDKKEGKKTFALLPSFLRDVLG